MCFERTPAKEYLRHYSGYKMQSVLRNPSFIWTISNFSTFRLMQQPFSKTRCWMKHLNNLLTVYTNKTFFFFECKKINRLTLIFGYNSQISVEEFIFITRLIQVQIWSKSLPKYGSTIIKSFRDCTYNKFWRKYSVQNYFIYLSAKSQGQLFLCNILFNIFILYWNFPKSEHKLKYWNNSDLIKLVL